VGNDEFAILHKDLARIAKALEVQNKITADLIVLNTQHWQEYTNRQKVGMTTQEVQAEIKRDTAKRKEKAHADTNRGHGETPACAATVDGSSHKEEAER